jgi:hypothetical protein
LLAGDGGLSSVRLPLLLSLSLRLLLASSSLFLLLLILCGLLQIVQVNSSLLICPAQ